MKANGLDSRSSFDDYDDLGEDDAYDDPDADIPAGSNRQRARARSYRPSYEAPNRKPASERETAFNALAWLLEGVTGAYEEIRNNDLGLDEEFWVHAYAARQEGLLAMRAVLTR